MKLQITLYRNKDGRSDGGPCRRFGARVLVDGAGGEDVCGARLEELAGNICRALGDIAQKLRIHDAVLHRNEAGENVLSIRGSAQTVEVRIRNGSLEPKDMFVFFSTFRAELEGIRGPGQGG